MEEQHVLTPTPISDDLVPARPTTYEMLMRQSRKLGGLATRTLTVTKQFLNKDISQLQPSNFIVRDLRPKQNTRDSSDSMTYSEAVMWRDTAHGKQQQKQKSESNNGGSREAYTLNPKDNLQSIVRKSHQVLAGARTVMLPVNLFPDSVIVDRTKVTITKRDFFWTANVISIRIEDVLNVSTNTGPFFGSLTISSRVMNSTDHYEINYFWRKDAIYLKQLIQGYVIAQHNRIETSHLSRDELIHNLLELGKDSDF